MEKLNYSQYIEKTIYQNIFDLQNWYANARYKILSIALPKKILIIKDQIEYIYDDIINESLVSLEDIYNKKIKEILDEPRTRYFARIITPNEL